MKNHAIILVAALALGACSDATPPAPSGDTTGAAPASASTSTPESINAPAGNYELDPYHTSLSFSVTHLGVSNYVMRFTDYDASLDLDPENPAASSVSVEIDPTSITTDFDGDYKGSHPDSPYESWEQDLARSPNFLNAGKYPSITFQSTDISRGDDGKLSITGDLTLLGQTRPVTLEASLVDAVPQHPMLGVAALGFSATGTFQRSDFGMTHLVEPPLVGDTVTLRFEGEFHQPKPASAEGP